MPIQAKSQITARARTRAPVPTEVIKPVSPPPTLATWVIDVAVVDATKMHERAVNVMLGAGFGPAEINAELVNSDGTVCVSGCMKVLFDFTLRSIETITECAVFPTQVYLEPLPASKV